MLVIDLGVNVTTAQTGPAINAAKSNRENFTVQVEGSGTFTADVQGSLDGANWQTLTSQNASAVVQVAACPFLRLVTSGMTSADVTARAVT